MKNLLLQLFREVSRILYQILGPEKSTKLSQSNIGKLIFSRIIGNKKKGGIYAGIDGIKLKLSHDEALSSGFLHLGMINPHETNLLKKILKEGDIFFDIGAYVDGWHSIIASKLVKDRGRIFTFEPVPLYFNKLSYNISLNKLKNVTLERLAISDKNGKQRFYIGGLASTLYRKHLAAGNEVIDHVMVSTMMLDAYIAKKNIKNVRLLKIDVEGAEMDVVKGAQKLLKKKNAPDLMMEVADSYLKHGNTTESSLLQELKRLGYRAYSITDRGLSKYVSKGKGRELMNVYFSKRPSKSLPLSTL